MLPKWHFLAALILSIFLFPIVQFKILIFILVAVFIDVDHYLLYIYRKKDFNLIRAYSFFIEKGKLFRKTRKYDRKYSLCVFHTIEFLILLIILIPTSSFFQIAMLGYSLHMIQDILSQIFMNSFNTRNYSIVGYIYERQNFNKKEQNEKRKF